MLKRKLRILPLIACLIFASVPAALAGSTSQIVYVAGDGSGDFNCDGQDDHIQINQALKFVAENSQYTTVYLKGPFTYTIDSSLLIGSNTILEGDSNAVLKLADNAKWPKGDWTSPHALIQQRESSGIENVEIRGFEIDGNQGNQNEPLGSGYYNQIHFYDAKKISVHDMYMHNGNCDGLRVYRGSDIKFYNNKVYKLGHDALYAFYCYYVEAYNNEITCRTNSALRMTNTNHVKLHDNIIDGFEHWSAGGPGIEIEKTSRAVNDLEIYNNIIHNTWSNGILLEGYFYSYPQEDAQNVHIHHNIFYNIGPKPDREWNAAIQVQGFYDTLIENNVFDGNYHAAIISKETTEDVQKVVRETKVSGCTTIVRNNIIVNTKKRIYQPEGTGYGIIEYLPNKHKFTLENNIFYNNEAGDYKNVKSTTDLNINPLFADPEKHDYHLKSTSGRWDGKTWVIDSENSPAIDAGYSSSDYSKEPEDNGDRINIGAYGNTRYASLSGSSASEDPTPEDPTSKTPEGYDNRIREATPDGIYPKIPYLDIGGLEEVGRYRDLLWYELKAPEEQEVTKATLSLYWYYPENKARAEDTVVEVYRPAKWEPDSVSWNNKESSTAWKNPGGDWFDKNGVAQGKEPYATLTLKGSEIPDNNYYEIDVTELVREYLEGKYENTGFFLKAKSEGKNYIAFYSNEGGNEAKGPKLNLEYAKENKAPHMETVEEQTVEEGSTLTFSLKASDSDGDSITYSAAELPEGAALESKSGIFTWTPETGQAGTYNLKVTGSDGELKDSIAVKITVTEKEKALSETLEGYDTRIREATPDGVYSKVPYLDIGGLEEVGRYRDLLWYELKAPEEQEVTKATLSLYWYYPENKARAEDTVVEVYRPAKWEPDSVSWNNKESSTAWKNPGGD
ncbi:MAG: disaggregatase related repeat-containing protein, partial [Methanosarcinaceae archaeon]|nr:disaggregatase related repeat-containing protein [Methanosarcinaceae archaeon]